MPPAVRSSRGRWRCAPSSGSVAVPHRKRSGSRSGADGGAACVGPNRALQRTPATGLSRVRQVRSGPGPLNLGVKTTSTELLVKRPGCGGLTTLVRSSAPTEPSLLGRGRKPTSGAVVVQRSDEGRTAGRLARRPNFRLGRPRSSRAGGQDVPLGGLTLSRCSGPRPRWSGSGVWILPGRRR